MQATFPPLRAATLLSVCFALLLTITVTPQPAQAEEKQIDFSKYDKEMLLLVIDQMQKRIKSLERENELLREKIGDGRSTSRRTASSDSGKSAGSSSSNSANTGPRDVGKRGQRTEQLKQYEYLADSHRTYVGTGDRVIETGTNLEVKLGISASYEGKQPPAEPKSFTMTITVSSSYRSYTTHNSQTEMALFLDGEKVDVGINHYQHWHVSDNREGKKNAESLITFIKPDLMQRIANAQSITVKTVPRSFELDQDMVQAIRDLNDFFVGK